MFFDYFCGKVLPYYNTVITYVYLLVFTRATTDSCINATMVVKNVVPWGRGWKGVNSFTYVRSHKVKTSLHYFIHNINGTIDFVCMILYLWYLLH